MPLLHQLTMYASIEWFCPTSGALLKIKLYIYGESLAAAGCQRLALNLRPAMVTVK